MAIAAREHLARLLTDAPVATSQSASMRLSADVLEVHVDGVGAVPLPVLSSVAKKLAASASPAHFGQGEDTVLDTGVRDTGEISPDRVRLSGATWEPSLRDAVERLGLQLGVDDPRRLRAELHSLLVYGKGQFFATHQDSEKHDDMVATLVVMLPSHHTGGELVVLDGGAPQVYSGSASELVLVAFYTDCRHEVLPVRRGHRVTLTFNILLDPEPESAPSGPTAQAAALITEHFSTPVRRAYRTKDHPPPNRLAVLLDHEYSQRALTANRLKGEDARRVALLRAAAEAAGCESVLAQTEIQETWDAVPSEATYRSWDYWGHDEDEEDDPEDMELSGLIDGSTVLTWWTDRESAGAINVGLDDEEVCAATPSIHLTPYASEYEGYMGNYGNTVDRWYRRAALVLWPKDLGFAMRAEASPEWGMRRVLGALADGAVEQARSETADLITRWSAPERSRLEPALQIALGVDDGPLAARVLAPFTIEMLTADHARALTAVVRHYPATWWTDLLTQWTHSRRYAVGGDTSRRAWIETEFAPVHGAFTAADGADIGADIADRMGRWLVEEARGAVQVRNPTHRSKGLTSLGPSLAVLLSVADGERGAEIAEAATGLGELGIPLLLAALRARPGAKGRTAAIDTVARWVHGQLQAVLARPPRSADDWSIAWTSPGGADEDRLAEFLNAADERTLAWPLAAPRRQVIHRLIDEAGLPVTHVTVRSGSPYTLMLDKTEALFTREAAERTRATKDLAWVAKTFDLA
ncbi:MAG TPA: 2OG-Fe(II) oxygenase [Intrasporangiaceae bacterium]|nr:2OG-Fe(II) oxygenase [Intrasporangiaceae bacterium]